MVIRRLRSPWPDWSRNWPALLVRPTLAPSRYTVAWGIDVLSRLSCTVISRFVACTALQNAITQSSAKRKRIRDAFIVNNPSLLVFYPIGSQIPLPSDFREGWHPVKKHSFHHYRHEMTPIFHGFLEPPLPFSINRKKRFTGLDKCAFFCMEQDAGPTVMGCPRNTCKRVQGYVVHLYNVSGYRGVDHKLVLARHDVI